MVAERRFTVAALYPDRLNIYADRGNLLFLERRCLERGIGFEVEAIGFGESFDPARTSLVYIGGGQDRDQALCAEDLIRTKLPALAEAAATDRPLLAVCGGYQLLGRGYEAASGWIPGTGIAPLETRAIGENRLIGPVAIDTGIPGAGGGILAGFENHAGRTRLDDPKQALGRVLRGFGNNGADGLEGFRSGALIGTYLHGPLLPKNWWFADWLIARGLGLDDGDLDALDDRLERLAHAEALAAAGVTASTP